MALARARRSESGFNYWPGFVDALSTLVLSIVFLLSVFLVVQFFLSQEVTGKDKALEQLNARIAELNDLLSLEKLGQLNLNDQLSQMRAGLASAEAERDRIKGLYDGLAGAGTDAAGRASELNRALDSEKQVSSRALAQIEVLNQQISALRRQLAALEEALDASEKRDKESQGRIADLGQRLMSRWRSGCRNCRATVRNSSDGCAPSSATGRTSGSSATASCSSRKCSSTPDRRCCCPKAAPNSTNWRPR
jgi:chemotaxis protein MotB